MMGFLPNFLARRPLVAEHDFAGVVVDANGSKWQNGQDVYGSIMFRETSQFYFLKLLSTLR